MLLVIYRKDRSVILDRLWRKQAHENKNRDGTEQNDSSLLRHIHLQRRVAEVSSHWLLRHRKGNVLLEPKLRFANKLVILKCRNHIGGIIVLPLVHNSGDTGDSRTTNLGAVLPPQSRHR